MNKDITAAIMRASRKGNDWNQNRLQEFLKACCATIAGAHPDFDPVSGETAARVIQSDSVMLVASSIIPWVIVNREICGQLANLFANFGVEHEVFDSYEERVFTGDFEKIADIVPIKIVPETFGETLVSAHDIYYFWL